MLVLGERLRKLRVSKDWSQSDLSQRAVAHSDIEIPHETISRIENGLRFPTVPMLHALAQALETTTDYLLGLADDPGVVVPRFPVPEADIAPLVARFNALPGTERGRISQIVGLILGVWEGEKTQPAAGPPRDRDEIVAFLDGLTDDDLEFMATAADSVWSTRKRKRTA